MARIEDVATLAGTSVGTVSRVVNGNSRVRPDLRARVEAAIETLGYRPNALAQSLRRRRSRTLGLVVPDITNPFFAELAKNAEAAAAAVGHSLILCNSHDSLVDERIYLQTLIDRQVDGVILVPIVDDKRVPLPKGIPIVVVDRYLPGADVVMIDHAIGERSAAEYLVGLGHRLIACISGPRAFIGAKLRHRGYAVVVEPLLSEVRLNVDDYSRFGSFDYQGGLQAARELLRLQPRPTAILTSSDQQAVGVLRACADLDLAVPKDVSVVGFDDTPLARIRYAPADHRRPAYRCSRPACRGAAAQTSRSRGASLSTDHLVHRAGRAGVIRSTR